MRSTDDLFPDQLRLVDGKLALKDGGDVDAYIRAWAAEAGAGPDTPLSITTREQAVKLYRAAAFGFNTAA